MQDKRILTFLLFATCEGLPTEKGCCETKSVGNFEYFLISEGEVPPACTSGCIYQREDKENSKYCFAPGNLPVTCRDMTSETLNSCSCEETDSPKRIFGGVNQAEAKWQVALVNYPRQQLPGDIFCGGSLITSNIVVTAAHCMFDKHGTELLTDAFQAALDLVNVAYLSNVLFNMVLSFTLNSDYIPSTTNKADIALIKIADVHSRIHPICLPPPTPNTYSGVCGKTTGWGLVKQGFGNIPKELPSILQGLAKDVLKKPMKILTNSECRSAWSPKQIPHYFVCFADKPGRGTCRGDSGGPLTIRQKQDNALIDILVGVTSFGPTDCRSPLPSVFIRVTYYLQWIKDTINEMGGEEQPERCDGVTRGSGICVCC